MSTPDDIRREARKAARVPTGAAGAGVFVPGVRAAEGDIDHRRDSDACRDIDPVEGVAAAG